jgi:hypothetical protein
MHLTLCSSWSGGEPFGEQKNIEPHPGVESKFPGVPARGLISVLIKLFYKRKDDKERTPEISKAEWETTIEGK